MEPSEGKVSESLNSGSISTRLERIAELARRHPERAFMSLHHVIDVEWLREAYRRTRKSGAVGVDGRSAADYERELEANLLSTVVEKRANPASPARDDRRIWRARYRGCRGTPPRWVGCGRANARTPEAASSGPRPPCSSIALEGPRIQPSEQDRGRNPPDVQLSSVLAPGEAVLVV
jgi:hypothetical protein